MKIFGPKMLAPACVPDRTDLASLAERNRHRINRLVIEARKGHHAAALLYSPDALYVAFAVQYPGTFCCRCVGEFGSKLAYQKAELTSSTARFVIARLIANINLADTLPL